MNPDAWRIADELVAYMIAAATRPTLPPGGLVVHRVITERRPPRRPRKGDLFCPSEWFKDAAS